MSDLHGDHGLLWPGRRTRLRCCATSRRVSVATKHESDWANVASTRSRVWADQSAGAGNYCVRVIPGNISPSCKFRLRSGRMRGWPESIRHARSVAELLEAIPSLRNGAEPRA